MIKKYKNSDPFRWVAPHFINNSIKGGGSSIRFCKVFPFMKKNSYERNGGYYDRERVT